jgi:hypothetical protein
MTSYLKLAFNLQNNKSTDSNLYNIFSDIVRFRVVSRLLIRREKLRKSLLFKKAARQMLLKWTPAYVSPMFMSSEMSALQKCVTNVQTPFSHATLKVCKHQIVIIR